MEVVIDVDEAAEDPEAVQDASPTADTAATDGSATAVLEEGTAMTGQSAQSEIAADAFETDEEMVADDDVDADVPTPDDLEGTLTEMYDKELQQPGRDGLDSMSFTELLWGNWDGFEMTPELLRSLEVGVETKEVVPERPTALHLEIEEEAWDPQQLLLMYKQQL